jgi:hypothetical protein
MILVLCVIVSYLSPIWSDVIIDVESEIQLKCQIILQIWGGAKLTELFISFHFVPLFLSSMGWVGVVQMGH